MNGHSLPPAPTRRVVLLGASNLTMNVGRVHCLLRQLWPEPLDILAAMGHGRSYGMESFVLVRRLPSIVDSQLWHDLARRPPLPTVALVTDIGNDILYNAEVDELSKWVTHCVSALSAVTESMVITELPLSSVRQLGAARFRLLASLYFPRLQISYASAIERAAALNERLPGIAARYHAKLASVDARWYGVDGIHHSWRGRAAAWKAFVEPLRGTSGGEPPAGPGPHENGSISQENRGFSRLTAEFEIWRWGLRLVSRRPHVCHWFGRACGRAQPALQLANGTRWSFY